MWFNNDTETKSHWIHEQQLIFININYYFHVWNSKILKPLIHDLKFPAVRPVSEFLKIAFFIELIADCFYFSNHLTPVYFVINEVLTIFMTHSLESEIHNDCYFHVDSFNIIWELSVIMQDNDWEMTSLLWKGQEKKSIYKTIIHNTLLLVSSENSFLADISVAKHWFCRIVCTLDCSFAKFRAANPSQIEWNIQSFCCWSVKIKSEASLLKLPQNFNNLKQQKHISFKDYDSILHWYSLHF